MQAHLNVFGVLAPATLQAADQVFRSESLLISSICSLLVPMRESVVEHKAKFLQKQILQELSTRT